jgi:hypothetical protein
MAVLGPVAGVKVPRLPLTSKLGELVTPLTDLIKPLTIKPEYVPVLTLIVALCRRNLGKASRAAWIVKKGIAV